MFVEERFTLSDAVKQHLRSKQEPFGFNGLGALTFYTRYSRTKPDGVQETWADCVIRVIESVGSIFFDQLKKANIQTKRARFGWETLLENMAVAMYDGKWLPPGRGLWAHGPYVWERGAFSLQNCGYTANLNLPQDLAWTTDALMCGVGVGFDTRFSYAETFTRPKSDHSAVRFYHIPDSREGWVESVRLLVEAYTTPGTSFIQFDYSEIRPEGAPIRGFGGTSSGPKPLMKLHARMHEYLGRAANLQAQGKLTQADRTRLSADLYNAVGACVVAGNVRRSAEIALGHIDDETFMNLKNVAKYPERQDISWLSNNSAALWEPLTAQQAVSVAERVRDNGEPGIVNVSNIQKWARLGHEKADRAVGMNPCAEIPLEDHEVCCLAEVFPTRCKTETELLEAVAHATFYASVVSMLPTHSQLTNAVVERNHRIGVSMTGLADFFALMGEKRATHILEKAYKQVEKSNSTFFRMFGLPGSVRMTTVKPSGTVSLLMGASPGMHWPTFTHAVRRIRQAANSPLIPILIEAGIPFEEDVYSDNTLVFEFPISHGNTPPATDVPLAKQVERQHLLQKVWADNAVSCTLYFNPKDDAEIRALPGIIQETSRFAKSASFLPHVEDGVYAQSPYTGISQQEYHERLAAIQPIRWEQVTQTAFSDGEDSRYCDGDSCLLPV